MKCSERNMLCWLEIHAYIFVSNALETRKHYLIHPRANTHTHTVTLTEWKTLFEISDDWWNEKKEDRNKQPNSERKLMRKVLISFERLLLVCAYFLRRYVCIFSFCVWTMRAIETRTKINNKNTQKQFSSAIFFPSFGSSLLNYI